MHWRLVLVRKDITVLGPYAYAIALAIYFLGILVMAPASLINTSLQRASGNRLHLAEAQGTLWSGMGQIEVRDSDGRAGISKSIAWNLLPQSLLHGHLAYEMELDHASTHIPLVISPGRVSIAKASLNLPVTALGIGAPRLAALGLSGELSLNIERFSFSHAGLQGNISLQWRNAGSVLAPGPAFGEYVLHFNGDGNIARVTLRTLKGPLQMNGEGSVARDGAIALPITITVPKQNLSQVSALLRMISIERQEGVFELSLR